MRGWLGVRAASEYCDVSVRTLRSWLGEGQLKSVRVRGSGKILIKVQWLDEFLENFTVQESRVDQIVAQIEKDLLR